MNWKNFIQCIEKQFWMNAFQMKMYTHIFIVIIQFQIRKLLVFTSIRKNL